MYTRVSPLLAIIIAATSLTAGCSKQSPTPETTEATGTIVAAKRALNTDTAETASSDNTGSAPDATAVAAAEEAAKGPSADSTMEAKDAAKASAGGPKNGDREIDHNKW